MKDRQIKVREMEQALLTSIGWSRRPGNLPHPFLPVKQVERFRQY